MDADFATYAAARWPRLVRSAVLLGCDAHEAEDVAQAALERCLVRWDRLVSRADDVDAYVHRVLITTFVSSRRRPWRRERSTPRLPDTIAAPPGRDLHVVDVFARALADLTPEHRAVVVLRYFSGLGERQTAEALGIPTGTVKSRLHRALAALAANPHLADLQETR
ncbi:MAG TPA: SigE family RNA polymerase sigma factor [Nocardioides sp.]